MHTHTVKTSKEFKLTCLASSGKAVLVGTNIGTIGIFDAETKKLIRTFKWHVENVQAILIMPEEVIPCMCAEVPFAEDLSYPSTVNSLHAASNSTFTPLTSNSFHSAYNTGTPLVITCINADSACECT